MGLFSGFSGKSSLDKAFNTYEAVSGVLLSVVASDGDISEEEVDTFSLTANRHPIFVSQSPHEFRKMVDEQFAILRRSGWKVLIQKAASHIPQNLKGTTFALAVDFVLADGQVDRAEEELIELLRELTGIAEDEAMTIIKVLMLKNGL